MPINGGPAFPRVRLGVGAMESAATEGMSLRDYFAGQLVIGILSSEANPVLASARLQAAKRGGRSYEAQLAVEAYQLANAMLVERDRLSEQEKA